MPLLISDLPEDILLAVAQFLSVKDVLALKQVRASLMRTNCVRF